MAEGDFGGLGGRRAGEVLVELRDGRSVSSEEDDDVDVQAFIDHTSPFVFDCAVAIPLDLPQRTAQQSLPSPRNSPLFRSPHLRPSPLRIQSSPIRLPFSAAFEDTLLGPLPRSASANEVGMMPSSPTDSVSSFLSLDGPPGARAISPDASSSRSSSFAKQDDKRRKRGSTTPTPNAVAALVAKAARPPLHTYTSFDEAFDIHPPPSPPPSPKAEQPKSWWGLGA
ncbi:hypothetical protein RQP46_005264 [Phenoliferia psychrophenolica]